MNWILTVFLLLWSSGFQAAGSDSSEHDDIRLMGGASRCAGGLEMKLHDDWKQVDDLSFDWNLRTADVVCRRLDCGSVVSTKIRNRYMATRLWKINASSVQFGSALRDSISARPKYSSSNLEITCSESVRLVNGTTLCSGRVEVRAKWSWASVCKGDFDWQDAEIVCRELGCGAPLDLIPYENTNADIRHKWTKRFQCRGNETSLLDCESHESTRDNCSPVGLTCSEPDNVRLVGGSSNCSGRLEMKLQGVWRPVDGLQGDLGSATLVCSQLKCGFGVSAEMKPSRAESVWGIAASRVQSQSALREGVSTRPWHSRSSLEIICSDLLLQPEVSILPSTDWIYELSGFTIRCSIQPQHPGGSFQLTFTNSYSTHNYTQEATDHNANFLFSTANHGHQGNYSCVYHVNIFSHDLYSPESQPLFLNILASPVIFMIRSIVLLLTLMCFLFAICYAQKATRGQQSTGQENIKLDQLTSGASRGDGLHYEEAAAPSADV